jgi:PAS domain S-box-containing protein
MFQVATFILSSLLIPLTPAWSTPNPPEREAITLALKWYHQFQFAGYYAAIHKGFYANEGLDVTLTTPQNNQFPVESVMSGKAQYGVTSSDLIKSRVNGLPVVALATIFQHSPIILMSRYDRELKYPSDYTGKTLMYSLDDIFEIKAMLVKEGIDADTIKIIPHPWSIDDVVNGSVDASVDYLTNEPWKMRARGVEPRIIRPIDYGIDFYGDTLFTTEGEIRAHPERVKAFRRASLKGWAYALNHIDEMIDLILTLPELESSGKTRDHLRYEAEQMLELIQPQLVEIGHMNPARWENMALTYAQFDVIPKNYTLDGFLYNPHQEATSFLVRGLKWAALVSLVFALGALLILIWNWRLRSEIRLRTQELKKSREQISFLAEYSTDILVIIDAEGQQKYISPAAERITGYTPDELKVGLDKIIHPDDLPAVYEKWEALLAHPDKIARVQYRHIHKTTGWIYLEAIGRNCLDDPVIQGFISNVRDISDRLEAEAKLKHALEENRALLDSNPDLMFLFDQDCVVVDCHPKVHSEMYYRDPEEFLGHPIDAFLPPELTRTVHHTVTDVLKHHSPVFITYHLDIHGKREYFESRYVPCGEKRVLAIVRNISDRVQSEAQQDLLKAQLAQSQKMESVGRLAGGVAHDFNNMLGVIRAHTEMGLMESSTDTALHQRFEEISKAAKRSAELVKQLLSFARQQPVSPKTHNLNQLIENTLSMLRRLIGEDLELIWTPDPNLWPVRIDDSQFDQVLANLCVNARDAIINTGRILIETSNIELNSSDCQHLAESYPGKFVRLNVTDTGCGMDEEALTHLFEPFYTTKEKGKGTGLGLATLYGIVHQNSGFIEVKSQVAHGSTFSIYFPVSFEAIEQSASSSPRPQETSSNPEPVQETILLVEDEPMIMEVTTMMLERFGYQVITALTAEEALHILKETPDTLHMLLTDVIMPKMNGKDLADTVKELYPDIKVLFMSGYTDDVIAHHGVLDEGVNFIAKPFSLMDLTAKVRDVLDT